MSASADGAAKRRQAAVVAYWAAAVLFVADIAVVQDWLGPPPATADVPDADASPTPTTSAAPVDTTIRLAGGAQVTFPAAPTEAEQVLVIAGTETVLRLHTAEGSDGATYNMGEIEYPPQVNLSDPAQNLLASVSGAAGNVNGEIVDRRVIQYQGAPAVEFTVDAEDVRLQARHVLDGRRLLAQNVAYKGAEPDEADAFFDSLQLIPDAAATSPSPTATASPGPSR